ncbi:MAG: twin-arginine translocase subunit TatC [Gemmatimonadaceae bacterium]|nr:twin-arginine translocase subunit TatC [Gemmatimonadaceae bacterium]
MSDMPFLDHLEELRQRLLKIVVAVTLCVAIGFVLVIKFDFINILERPILPYLDGRTLIFTHPGDSFSIVMQVSFGLGFALAAPVMLYQLWAFLSPALYKHEKKVVIPLLFAATCLFMMGAALAYFFVLPFALKFLMDFQTASLTPMITARDYFDFATSLALSMGAVFELPILLVGLTALGIITPAQLRQFRRHALVASFAGAAIITPGDLITTTVMLAVPLYALYEVSIIASALVFRRRERRRLASDAGQDVEVLA